MAKGRKPMSAARKKPKPAARKSAPSKKKAARPAKKPVRPAARPAAAPKSSAAVPASAAAVSKYCPQYYYGYWNGYHHHYCRVVDTNNVCQNYSVVQATRRHNTDMVCPGCVDPIYPIGGLASSTLLARQSSAVGDLEVYAGQYVMPLSSYAEPKGHPLDPHGSCPNPAKQYDTPGPHIVVTNDDIFWARDNSGNMRYFRTMIVRLILGGGGPEFVHLAQELDPSGNYSPFNPTEALNEHSTGTLTVIRQVAPPRRRYFVQSYGAFP